MTNSNTEANENLELEQYTPAALSEVSALIVKFAIKCRQDDPIVEEMGLKFKSGLDKEMIDRLVADSFVKHPELEEKRVAMDKVWWDGLTDDEKKAFESNQDRIDRRKGISRYRTLIKSPFANEYYQESAEDHLKNTDAQTQLIVVRDSAVLGYLAVWNGASTLYLDDHMQVDAKIIEPDLNDHTKRLVAAKFEPELQELSLP